MLRHLLTWWATQMLGWLPAALRRPRGEALSATLLPDNRLELSRRGVVVRAAAGPDELRGGASFRRAPVVLRLPAGTMLERQAFLPLAAERDLRGVVGFEMDRLTPFPASALHWSAAPLRRDAATGRLLVRLLLVPRTRVAKALEALEAAGLRPRALEAAGPDGTTRRLSLAAAAAPSRPGATRLLLALCAVLLLAAAGLPFARQEARLSAVERRIAALRPAVEEAEALRRRTGAGGNGRNVVAAERARLGNALGTLAALTNVLPDDTFLLDLSLRDGELSVSGRSASAVRLIALLSADPAFRDPAFAAPVVRAEGAGGRDQFSLRALVAPPPAPGG